MAGNSPMPACAGQLAEQDRSWKVITVAFTLWGVAAICVLLRFLSRHWAKSGYGLDDWMILVPLVGSLAYSLSTIPLYNKGFGKHYTCASPGAIPFFLKTLLAWEFLYTIILATTKYSILLFLYRVFHVEKFKRLLWVMAAIITAWAVAVIVVSALSCRPLHAFWGDGTGRCISTKKFYVGNSVPNIATDVALLCLPLPYIVRLNTPRSYKIALIGVFACGALVIFISIARMVALLTTDISADVTWEDVPEVLWTLTEDNVAIVCACLPSMGPLLKVFLQKVKFNSTTPWLKRSGPDQSKSSERSRNLQSEQLLNSRTKYESGFIELKDIGTGEDSGQ